MSLDRFRPVDWFRALKFKSLIFDLRYPTKVYIENFSTITEGFTPMIAVDRQVGVVVGSLKQLVRDRLVVKHFRNKPRNRRSPLKNKRRFIPALSICEYKFPSLPPLLPMNQSRERVLDWEVESVVRPLVLAVEAVLPGWIDELQQ